MFAVEYLVKYLLMSPVHSSFIIFLLPQAQGCVGPIYQLLIRVTPTSAQVTHQLKDWEACPVELLNIIQSHYDTHRKSRNKRHEFLSLLSN